MRSLLKSLGASLLGITALVLIVTLVAPARGRSAASGGSLDERIRSIGSGEAYFSYDTWPDVRGDEECNITRGDPDDDGARRTITMNGGNWKDSRWNQRHLEPGPMNVRVRVRKGVVTKLETCVGESWKADAADGVDLGHVSAAEAADYLLALARENGNVGDEAIVAAIFVNGADVWPRMFGLARDRSLDDDVRSSALFWIGQEAGERAVAELVGVAEGDDEESDVRESAVFALSQRPEDESIPVLTRLARSSPHPEVRKSALFWLAQHDDPQVIDFFEEILSTE
jgi:hypothetical protein